MVVLKSCAADVNLFLQNLVKTHDLLLTISVHQHLADKIKPVFFILNHIKADEYGEYKHESNPKSKDLKGNEASGSKGKGKLVESNDEKEEDLSEVLKLKRKKRDQELDEAQHVAKEAEATKKEACDAQVTLKTQKSLFPPWSMERILNEAIDNRSVYWLELVVSFDLDNSSESRLEFPVTPKAFLFRCFERIVNAPDSENDVNQMLLFFISSTESLAVRGAGNSAFEFTFTDLPCLYPYDWISLFSLLSKYDQKFETIIAHLKIMLVSYIQEVGRMDVEIAAILRKKPIVQQRKLQRTSAR
ncbi:unnamed protein product [Lactuca saligna]|uniref:Uncharacterized protein n=1 Tax=Lactuca saligna TaxID=75948 RepID=A0AA35YD70_LACSI|nr:unnamed protein product [Lactuca saligna]